MIGIPVAVNVPGMTAVAVLGEHWNHDKTEDVLDPGFAAQETHAGLLGCAVLDLVVELLEVVGLAEKLASDCHVVHTVDNLAVAVAHGKGIAADVVVAVTGEL